MEYFINNAKVTRSKAKEYVDGLWGAGTLESRETEAKEQFMIDGDDYCSWTDGFAIELKGWH